MSKFLSQDEVIKQFKSIHGDKYDYSEVVYTRSNVKVKIICPIHGCFYQTPNDHKKGKGCKQCGYKNSIEKQKLSSKEVIKQFKSIHGDKYDYSLMKYVNNTTKIDIICKEHGIFSQAPYAHKFGRGCPICGEIKKHTNQVFTKEKIIDQFIKTHGFKYDYSEVEYINSKTKVNIICKKHGVFTQTPDNHKKGVGCPICGELVFRKRYHNKPTTLYYIKINSLYKIGITTMDIKHRYYSDKEVDIKVIKEWNYDDGLSAWTREQSILEKYKEYKYVGEKVINVGNSELFTKDVLSLDIV